MATAEKTFKTQIEYLIHKRGLDPKVVAGNIGFRDPFDWYRFLTGVQAPSRRQLEKLMDILCAPASDLVGRDGYPRLAKLVERTLPQGFRPWSVLHIRRLELGRSAEDMGALIGVSATEWKHLERRKGVHPTTPEQRRAIADALGLEVHNLWYRNRLEKPSDWHGTVTFASNWTEDFAADHKSESDHARASEGDK